MKSGVVQGSGRRRSQQRQSWLWLLGSLLLGTLPGMAQANEVFGPSDVPLLDNRFRIDYGIKEVSFIIKRQPGSPSVILVRPDGSKLYAGRVQAPEVGWLALGDQDVITIRHPMAGPWQAIGAVDPSNRVRLLSDVTLDMQPLPQRLYQGEYLKLGARLLIDGNTPDRSYYLTDLGMTARLQGFSTPEQQGEPVFEKALGHYLDDGKGLDEAPVDGILTAEVLLDAPAGKYRALISTGNQVFVRARGQEVLLYPLPVNYQLRSSGDQQGPELVLQIDGDELDPATVAIKGETTSNTGAHTGFSAQGSTGDLKVDLAKLTQVGKYRVSAELFATSRSGRELRIALPDKSFDIYPALAPVAPAPLASEAVPAPAPGFEEEQGTPWWLWLTIGLGVLALLGAGVGFMLWQKRRAFQRAMAAQQAAEAEPGPVLDLNLPGQ
ncbi:TIGR03503 family protein [Aeromonas rivuli]|uniref:TIGR03503 family protein n=1 Tax=Aeromonas rivuli TaxID=648794 RepID=UPI001CCDACF7|nr:TIGR03503 family protein [Aeromonas rivuli]UBO75394.1 TIGR03503 family protein [Aeromonas rivuli]